jgi:DNA-binding CsgD family transcriptional regulator
LKLISAAQSAVEKLMTFPESGDDLIDGIYRGATDANAFKLALTDLAARFQCRGAALISFDQRSPAAQLLLNVGACEGDVFSKYQEFAAFDPAPGAFAKLAAGTVSTSSRVLSDEQLKDGVFTNEFFFPLGFRETLGAALFAERSRFALMGLIRGAERTAFSEQEIAELGQYVPHLIRAIQLRRAFVDLEAKSEAMQQVVDRLEAGVLLANQTGAVFFLNQAASAIVGRKDGLSLDRAGRLVAADTNVRRRLDKVIAATCRGGSGAVMAAPRKESANAYGVLVAPASSTMRNWFGAPPAGGVVVLIHDPVSRPRKIADVLQSALGLKPAAAKLAAALAGDDDLRSFAEREGITIHTARFHLHSALAMTGTRTQAELVRVVVRLLRDLALREGP